MSAKKIELNEMPKFFDVLKVIISKYCAGFEMDNSFDLGDPTVVSLPGDSGHYEAPGQIQIIKKLKVPRALFGGTKTQLKEQANVFLFSNGFIAITVDDSKFNVLAKKIADEYEKDTGLKAKLFLK